MTAIGGFFLASQGVIDWWLLISLLVGMALVIGASCVFNNYYDREIDAHMVRTKKRALASGHISKGAALTYGVVLGILGFAILLLWTNLLTTLLGLFGFLTYAGAYTWAKHRTPYATLLGTIPGAIPPVAGYTAVTGHLDLAAFLLFVILICWQMPHFFAIALRRLNEYKAAKVPVWPAVYGFKSTYAQMLLFTLIFIIACIRLSLDGYTGAVFAWVMSAYGLWWFWQMLKGRAAKDKSTWAKHVFLWSLIALPLMSILLILNNWLP
jgi:protoheme IX farnesyltransferase